MILSEVTISASDGALFRAYAIDNLRRVCYYGDSSTKYFTKNEIQGKESLTT